ncbi:DUF3179 domain-containing (seleno)protein [Melghirimyces profundicolus]|uniref:DUF3179 domain-containing (seleno)protein n=1 Tax=Melghirimyces profundicolus TaxID=1242148 RepID=UPI00147408B0|nr:DUF3179 domain-containing (seleno)protein [Melghirimyces profundicolus]
MEDFDSSRFMRMEFEPFLVEGSEPLKNAVKRGEIQEEDTVLVVGRGGEYRAFSMYQMTYNKVAQGSLNGLPYLATYCPICHTGTAMVPVIDGKEFHFRCVGVHNGIAMLQDRETDSYWNHVTGECVEGPLKGKKMDMLLLGQMTARQALKKYPNLHLSLAKQSWLHRMLTPIMNYFGKHGIYPPGYKKTIIKRDERLPDMTSGVGVFTKEEQKFYPIDTIEKAGGKLSDRLAGRPVTVIVDEDGFPEAYYEDTEDGEDIPQYLYTRWFGFSITYPGCKIHQAG